MALIAIKNISKSYNPGLFKRKVQAVRDLSLEIRRGEVFGLIGPNGAGKSSTIRLLLGLTRADAGTIEFQGKPLNAAGLQRHVGYLPENPYLYDHLTLDELLTFSGRASGLPADQTRRRSQELMERLDMAGARKRPLRTFSKGMLQRAGICFALLHDPDVVILDEPMSGLDPIGRRMVFDLVTDLKGQGKTIFFCSHILTDVERLCDRIGLMVNGRLVRVFKRADFLELGAPALHLVVSRLTEGQASALGAMVSAISDERDQQVLSFAAMDFAAVAGQLQTLGIDIIASRGERISLEEMFLRVVEENR